jgi:excisionase family DNA binding protein
MAESYYTVKEVAEKLKVTQPTVREAIKKGTLPHYRLARKVIRVSDSQIEYYLKNKLGIVEPMMFGLSGLMSSAPLKGGHHLLPSGPEHLQSSLVPTVPEAPTGQSHRQE